ncbi:sugar phosphate isomerase/epimerase and 4-hydroxyphenylpyruvate domain-containing protein [Devosia sp. BSSL-BM10]|uniref:3-dehydroshikimate dehydratase n=1 Tax=Devosia litorisediminis TaxID=2829817 RepID=A0A942I535_9HYPH|nr:sugar phosphate isomerase/epimerase and 4-hydroxyphenylpyruvate domain-containing protein [Devosia litorisediminis]MBS3848256.1 sugar phosphate isomerase/epimerase and 4-hydroxyphenylpyruvate domain-containing protein [Devosia litorisediminis]
MKTGIATVSISGDLREKLSAIANAGFDGIEIFENDFLAFESSPADVGKMVRDHGLEIQLFQPFRDFEGMPEPARSRVFDRAERKFDLMEQLGADLVLICSNVSPMALGGIDRAAADFAELGERAAKRGLRVGYEALAWGRHINDHRDAWEIVRRANHPNVGLILDSFHTLSRGIAVDSIRSIPADKIFFVQLADAPLIDMDLLYWSRHFRNMPGQGDLDVTGFTRAVLATGYSDVFSLEIFNDQFRGGSPASIALDGKRSLSNLMDAVQRVDGPVAALTARLPPPAEVEGVAFVEFAVGEAESDDLVAILSALGFRHAARHRAKDIDVWQQGEIRILLNRDREGFAHSSYIVHGAGVCDIGLRLDNSTEALERAKALGAKVFEQAPGPGELAIPAIRGLGGSILHFIDGSAPLSGVWELEFEAVDAQSPVEEAGLTRLDHIAQTMDASEMLTWQLFYNSLFATRKTPTLDVVDPAGLVRSLAIENSDGSFRFTLNGAENQRTLAGHFIAEGFGSAAQHIALQSNDIFATLAVLKTRGFVPLAISPNYYDDLAARFGLDDGFLEQLSASGVLYDRDEGGEFYQVYSQTYAEGFFFEIVERRGGYSGYGAANAPFRIAAQKRQLRLPSMPRH